jgi:hypothetical protein
MQGMTMKTLMAALAWGMLATSAWADDAAERATLKGLGDLRLAVANLSPGVEAQGLKKKELQAMLEQRLRAAGIRVLADGERARGMPTLFLNLILADADDAQTALIYSLDLTLSQEVRLVRAQNIRLSTTTWRTPGAVGIVEVDKLATLRDASSQAIDTFIAAYRAANGAK